MYPKSLLEACSELVRLTLKFDHPTDAIVAHFFRTHRNFGTRERATMTQTVYNVLRKKLFFEQLAPSGSGPKERRLAILGFADSGTWWHSALTEQEKKWLSACAEISPQNLMDRHRHNLPEWLAQSLKAQVGEEFWPLVGALNAPAGLDLRVNALKAKRSAVQAELVQAGIPCEPTPYSPWGLRVLGKPALNKIEAFVRGDIEIQDEGSQLLALLVDAKRSEMVVDFCAGAGGKTLALGAAMRSTGCLYAFDTSAGRLDALKPRMARSGLSNIHPIAIAHERDERVKRLAGKIDRVLVDAPCSGLGTLRRSPDLKWRQNMSTVLEMTAQQTAILQSAAKLLKPGGRLVYATCSLLPEENEAIAQAFSAAHLDFAPLQVGALLTQLGILHASSLSSGGEGGELYLRLWPHRHATDGFFAAVWEKKQ